MENKSDNMINIMNNSYISNSEDSNTNLNILDNNNINLFHNDSIISRIDSDLYGLNSESSRLDSIDKTCDETQKFFLNSNSNDSFQLEYKKDKNIGDKGIKVKWKKSKTIIGRNIIIDFILSYSVIGKRHKIKNDIIFK